MTVEEVLNGLNFKYCHCVIKRKENIDIVPLGGGSPDNVINRFGSLQVKESVIVDNVLIFFVV